MYTLWPLNIPFAAEKVLTFSYFLAKNSYFLPKIPTFSYFFDLSYRWTPWCSQKIFFLAWRTWLPPPNHEHWPTCCVKPLKCDSLGTSHKNIQRILNLTSSPSFRHTPSFGAKNLLAWQRHFSFWVVPLPDRIYTFAASFHVCIDALVPHHVCHRLGLCFSSGRYDGRRERSHWQITAGTEPMISPRIVVASGSRWHQPDSAPIARLFHTGVRMSRTVSVQQWLAKVTTTAFSVMVFLPVQYEIAFIGIT